MRPYSMDLRERVAAAIDAGEGSQRQVAKRFRVSVSFVTRLVQRRRDAGTLAPQTPRRRAASRWGQTEFQVNLKLGLTPMKLS